MSTGGLLMVLITVLGIVFDVSDSTGMRAVLATGVIAFAAVALAVIVIPDHYRDGRFDTRLRPVESTSAPAATINHDISVSIAELPVSVDDIFVTIPEEPIAELQIDSENQGFASEVELSSESAPDRSNNLEQSASALIEQSAEVVSNGDELRESALDQDSESLSETAQSHPEPAEADDVEPGQAFEPWVAESDGPVAASRAAYERTAKTRLETERMASAEPPLFPFEDELPAWNAPSPVTETPVVSYVPDPQQTKPTHQQLAAGFQSSLFADLELPREEPAEIEGKFKSRLLNELTDESDGDLEPGDDVLLDEFSLPQPGEPGTRGVGND